MADKKRYGVSPEDFVTAWQSSESVEEAAGKLGMPHKSVVARAASYRRQGVRLKCMPRGGRPALDVAGLNAVAGAV